MKNILFIASLNTKKEKYDGERIKSTFMHNIFKDIFNEKVINLSKHKIFNTLRIVFTSIFCKKKYDFVIVSKDPHGANIIFKIMKLFSFPMEKVLYFEIGPFLYDRILNGSIKKETFEDIKIIVETNSMKTDLKSIGIETFDIYPNFKPILSVPLSEKQYPKNILNLVYFSRIEEMKGIYELIDAICKMNKEKIKFKLDIFGRPSSSFDEKEVVNKSKLYEYIGYKGQISLDTEEGYKMLSNYDLHVFPTKYPEGFPGSIIDFFIAGVPTLSSKFARAYDILNDDLAYFYEKGNINDLCSKLEYIYNHQNQLSDKRIKNYMEKDKFSDLFFKQYILDLVERLSNE